MANTRPSKVRAKFELRKVGIGQCLVSCLNCSAFKTPLRRRHVLPPSPPEISHHIVNRDVSAFFSVPVTKAVTIFASSIAAPEQKAVTDFRSKGDGEWSDTSSASVCS